MSDPVPVLAGPPVEILLERPLTISRIYLHALAIAPFRAQGDPGGRPFRSVVVRQSGVTVRAERIARYREVCGFPEGTDGTPIPSCFLETLFLGPMATIVLSRAFPFSPLGLIHLKQHIEVRKNVFVGDRLDLCCTLAAIRPTDRGYEVDFHMETRRCGEVVWQGIATLLSRSRAANERRTRLPEKPTSERTMSEAAHIHVEGNIGRRYAAVSDDWNLHHLHPLTARLLGWSRPIAHGMWTLARCLALLEAENRPCLTVDATFKRPLLLPGEMVIRLANEGGVTLFDAIHPGKREPYVVGRASP